MDNIALKEWAVAVRAMEASQQDVIFRKGGIQEPSEDFELRHNEFLLYPAREHQKAEFLKPNYLPMLAETRAHQQGHIISICSRARVLNYHLITSLAETKPFNERHIWNEDFIQMRLDYKPDRPLYVIELSVELLERPLEFLETTEYTGCRSWVEL